MSRVILSRDKKILQAGGFKLDRIIRRRRRERDLKLKYERSHVNK